ncbi:MAG TPA: hypothetical protein DCR24_11510 [Bacillus bacterium]|nr:hypothetical protein [Bacillus sp. (in: firmicutes)]
MSPWKICGFITASEKYKKIPIKKKRRRGQVIFREKRAQRAGLLRTGDAARSELTLERQFERTS